MIVPGQVYAMPLRTGLYDRRWTGEDPRTLLRPLDTHERVLVLAAAGHDPSWPLTRVWALVLCRSGMAGWAMLLRS